MERHTAFGALADLNKRENLQNLFNKLPRHAADNGRALVLGLALVNLSNTLRY